MTESEFWEKLNTSKGKFYLTKFSNAVRTKKDCACPICYVANEETGRFYNNDAWNHAAIALDLPSDFTLDIVDAADNKRTDKLRNKLLETLGLTET